MHRCGKVVLVRQIRKTPRRRRKRGPLERTLTLLNAWQEQSIALAYQTTGPIVLQENRCRREQSCDLAENPDVEQISNNLDKYTMYLSTLSYSMANISYSLQS